jgi:hypothetical protein
MLPGRDADRPRRFSMPLRRRIGISLVTAIAFVAIISGSAQAIPAGKITAVTVSQDLRRVTIKSEGVIGPHTASVSENPSRLTIDMAGAGVAKNLQMRGVSQAAGLAVRVAKHQSGARVILDFGTSIIPAHKIRRLGNYLLVFLQKWDPKPISVNQIRREKVSLPDQPTPVVRRKTERPHNGSPAEVSIKSAEVVDGLVMVTLASRRNPGVTYRIDLGVDFEKLGFSTARISASDSKPPQRIKISSRKSPFWTDQPRTRIGPRKSPPSSATVQHRNTRLERTARLSIRQW